MVGVLGLPVQLVPAMPHPVHRIAQRLRLPASSLGESKN
jgi:hypothetical protein